MDLSKAEGRTEENIRRNELVLASLGFIVLIPKKRRTFSSSTKRNGSLSVLNKLFRSTRFHYSGGYSGSTT